MANLLDRIQSPADLKCLSFDELTTLAQEIRDLLIQTTAHTGGHLGPNLGIVELTLAWHYVFESPKDRLLMDVSHQSYVHKILTGRRDRFGTIRQLDGLNGFMLRSESPHDHFGAGHAGTALSAALGMAVGRDKNNDTSHVTALCGDAAFTCGITYEAMNNAAESTKRLIVVLNDNEWSIDKNVGAIAHYLNKIVTNETYSHLHAQAARFLERIGGRTALKLAHKFEESIKGLVAFPSTLFEELGFTYYGPLDGHNIQNLVQTFRFLKEQDHPVLLHALTKKGKGFDLAVEKAKKYHGIAPGTFDPIEMKEIESKPGVPRAKKYHGTGRAKSVRIGIRKMKPSPGCRRTRRYSPTRSSNWRTRTGGSWQSPARCRTARAWTGFSQSIPTSITTLGSPRSTR